MIAELDRLGWEFSLTLTDAACQVKIWSRKGFRDFMDLGRNYSDLVGQALLFALSCEKRKGQLP
ncbi:MAG: hypothetical protein K6U74_13600, partial [Firmicutes bacterium]|nr:hypothetical protein [Bacillota bacterium]